jgi:hypothetical protein
MASKKTDSKERAVVICTAKRGVFFGYTSETGDALIERSKGTIRRARMCTYWSKETHGVLGLAGIGPQKGSRIGPRVPALAIESISAVIDCSDDAAKAWEVETWG